MPRHYDETIPHFFDHLEDMFLGGGVYVTPPFDLDNQDYLRPTYFYFLFFSEKLLNDTLKLLRRMNLYECYMYLNNDGYDAIYCENVNFMNV
jgi:hypothetical protein